MEIRCIAFKSKWYWLASNGHVWGRILTGPPTSITTDADWRHLLCKHRWEAQKLPYGKTFGLPVLRFFRIEPVPYEQLSGQVGTALFRPLRGEPTQPRKKPRRGNGTGRRIEMARGHGEGAGPDN
jgi:hypothetical protein